MKSITKTVLPSKDVYIQFTEDEILDLGIKPGDKFDVTTNEDGSVQFTKQVPLDIDLDEFDPETLKRLVAKSLELDVPVSDIIREALDIYINQIPDEPYEF